MTHDTAAIDLGPAARELKALLEGVGDEELTARTPCEEYTVGDLLDHLMGLTLAFTDAARKTPREPGTAPAGTEVSAANLDPRWRRLLPRRLDELVAAWREPAAWTGETEAGGVTLPAEVMGVVALDELVVHGWDLARATGQPFDCDPAGTQAVFELFSQAEGDGDGNDGPFGKAVEVPADAPLLDRAIGLSGRDPSWTA